MPFVKQRQVGAATNAGQRSVRNAIAASAANKRAIAAASRSTTTASAACQSSVGGPTDTGFEGSIVQSMGGTTIMDPSTCGSAQVNASNGGTLGGLDNVDNGADCPNDGDILMWRAGSGTVKGQWTYVPLAEVFARNCLTLPETLGEEDCAAAKEPFQVTDGCNPTRSVRSVAQPTVVPPKFGDGSHGDFTLDADSQLDSDSYFQNLNIGSFELNLNGHSLFVASKLQSQNGSIISKVDSEDKPISVTAETIEGELRLVTSLPSTLLSAHLNAKISN